MRWYWRELGAPEGLGESVERLLHLADPLVDLGMDMAERRDQSVASCCTAAARSPTAATGVPVRRACMLEIKYTFDTGPTALPRDV